jgi:hypothetical protein
LLLADPLAPAVEMYQEVHMMEGVEIVDQTHTREAVGLKHLFKIFARSYNPFT